NLDLSSVVIVTSPAHGTADVFPGGVVAYSPDAGFSGDDSFTYRICDAAGLCAQAPVSVHVRPTQAVPVVSTAPYMPVAVTVTTGDAVVDADLDLRTVTIISAPGHGRA